MSSQLKFLLVAFLLKREYLQTGKIAEKGIEIYNSMF